MLSTAATAASIVVVTRGTYDAIVTAIRAAHVIVTTARDADTARVAHVVVIARVSSEDDDRELDGIAIIWGLTKLLKCLKELVGALRAKAQATQSTKRRKKHNAQSSAL